MRTNKYDALRTIAVINEIFAFIFLIGGILGTIILVDKVSKIYSYANEFVLATLLLAITLFLFFLIRALSHLIYLIIDVASDVNDVNSNICVLLEQYQKSNLENQEKIIQLLSKQNTNQIKINEDEL